MFNWLTATSSPRRLAGAISVIYIGQTTDAPPTATPPSHRKNSSAYQLHASAQPTDAMTNTTASIASTGRRPHQSAGRPTDSDPTIVPSSALDTVKPSQKSFSVNTCRSASVVPEITAVSKPKSSDPSAATMALIKRTPLPPPLRPVVAGDSVARGIFIVTTLVECRHRAAIVAASAQRSNTYATASQVFPPGNSPCKNPPPRFHGGQCGTNFSRPTVHGAVHAICPNLLTTSTL